MGNPDRGKMHSSWALSFEFIIIYMKRTRQKDNIPKFIYSLLFCSLGKRLEIFFLNLTYFFVEILSN